jgi:hypothetical protein
MFRRVEGYLAALHYSSWQVQVVRSTRFLTSGFLAATINGLFLIKNGKSKKLLGGSFYGITWNKDEIFLAAWNEPKVFIWRGEDSIKRMDCVPFPFRVDDTHQILWWSGSLYIVHTGYNRLDIWKNKRSIFSIQWHPFFTNNEQSAQHINSIWCDHSNFYIVEHNRGKLPVFIRVFDMEFVETALYSFSDINTCHNNGLHNVYIENNILYTLSVNNFIMRNLSTGKDKVFDIRSHNDIGYLRGFARDNNFFYIGESRISERPDRRKGNSNIIILNNSYQVKDIIELRDSGQLHDIRLLKNDFAHNSLDCPEVWL